MTRPDKHDFDTLTGNSWSVHGGNHADETTGAIRTPIVMANSYRLPEDPSAIDDPGYQGLVYTREHGANQRGLEEKLAKLDHGEAAAVFGTGMAALHAAFFTILNPGDHAIVSNVVYMRVAGLFTDVFPKKLGIEVDFVDITDLDAVRAAVRPEHQAHAHRGHRQPRPPRRRHPRPRGIAHDAGALLTIDSTFTPPPMMRPLDHGADLVIHSLTKYYNGHGDAMGGVVIGARDLVEETRTGAMWHAGGAISPFNAWLIMRGSTTLPLRLQRQCDNAQAVAEFLDADPRVAHVAYPGLPGHDQHDAARRPAHGGFGGVVSFAIGGTHADRLTFVNDLRVITSAVSLGHDETLIAYEEYPEGPAKAFAQPFRDHGLVRLAIGLEPTRTSSPTSTPP